MATLNQVSDDILDTLNRTGDIQLKERVKYVFLNELAATLRQEIHKRGVSNDMVQTYVAPIIKVDNDDSPNSIKTVIAYRTVNKVTKPVRYNTDDPFVSISEINGNGIYTYVKDAVEFYYRSILDINNNVGNKPVYYTFRNGYVYLYNIELTELFDILDLESDLVDIADANKFIIVSAVHNTFDFIDRITNDSVKYMQEFTVDTELPIADDIIQMAKLKLLGTDFSLINPKEVIATNIDNN